MVLPVSRQKAEPGKCTRCGMNLEKKKALPQGPGVRSRNDILNEHIAIVVG